MDLCEELLFSTLHITLDDKVRGILENLEFNAQKAVENECYKALQKIKAIISDDSLDDPECFIKIEEIVCALEAIGSSGSSRHDFG